MSDQLAVIRQSLKRLEKAEGRIARRNARLALFGAIRALRNTVNRDYPAIERPAKRVPSVADRAIKSGTWRHVEYRIVRPGRRAWNRERAEAFNRWFAESIAVTPKPIAFDVPDGARFVGRHEPDVIRIAGIDTRTRGRDAELWRTLLHEIAHYRARGHGAQFRAELVRVYRAWRLFMAGRV